VLTPDFMRKEGAIETVVAARPDVFNHNIETVPRLYPTIRPGARYFTSLRLLSRVKEIDPSMFTKSGLMVGLGETRGEILQVMDDLRAAEVDFLTVGQYLQPTPKHATIDRFWTPAEFDELAAMARAKGFLMVSASPLTRSSYHAGRRFCAPAHGACQSTQDLTDDGNDPAMPSERSWLSLPNSSLTWWPTCRGILNSCRGAPRRACAAARARLSRSTRSQSALVHSMKSS